MLHMCSIEQTGTYMLSLPLIRPHKLKDYLKKEYDYHSPASSYLARHKTMVKIELDTHLPDSSHTLYHDKKKNPGQVTAWDIALSLHSNSYITGYSALSILGWTEYTPTRIYVNWIRGINSKQAFASQNIDEETLSRIAFTPKKDPPVNLVYENMEIVILSGQYFTMKEKTHLVELPFELELPRYAKTFCNERLFIEALINYHWFGGADIVWSAFKEKAKTLDRKKLLTIYKEMRLKYPYASAIGYVLDHFAPTTSNNNPWLPLVNKAVKFHLFMGDNERRVFVDKWSLYVPKRFSL